jgi:hypothetical protein
VNPGKLKLSIVSPLSSNAPTNGRYVAFQMAEVAIPRSLFAEILRLIAVLGLAPDAAPA